MLDDRNISGNNDSVKEEPHKPVRVKFKSTDGKSSIGRFNLNAKSHVTKVGDYSIPHHEKERRKHGKRIVSMLK